MDVSVVILNYNTFGLTSRCIRSVLEYTKGVSVEIILVDNGSTECDPEKFVVEFPSVNLIRNPVNEGFAKGNNTGINKASGDFILLLNSDTELHEDAISACYQQLKQRSDIGIVTCRLIYPDGAVQKQCQRFPSLCREFMLTTRLIRLIPAGVRSGIFRGQWFDHLTPCEPDWVWGAFFMFRKKDLAIFPSSRLPETFFMYGEDLEWCWNFNRKGLGCYYCADVSVIHHLGKSSAARNTSAMLANEKDFIVRTKGRWWWRCYRWLRLMNYRISGNKYKELYDVLRKT